MKKYLFIIALLLLAMLDLEAQEIIAHRGYHVHSGAPENSLASLRAAVDIDVWGVEFDAQLTQDKIAVVFHDAKIEGRQLEDISYRELRTLSANTLSNGEEIPRVDHFVKTYAQLRIDQQARSRKNTRLFYEIKPQINPLMRDAAVDRAVELAEHYRLLRYVEFISYDIVVCQKLAKRLPDVHVYYLGGEYSPRELFDMGISGMDYHYKVLRKHPEWVEEAHDMGMRVVAWTVNDRRTALEVSKLRVDAITTDYPLDIPNWLAEESDEEELYR